MTMDRRNFLKIAGMTGLAVSAPFGVRHVLAQPEPYKGPYFVLINASGGWDPVYLCDPKAKGPLNRIYDGPATAGNLKYAPIPIDDASLGLEPGGSAYLMSNQQFFEKYASQLTVLNGIDMSTNNHDGGSRATWSGRLSEGFPSFGAIVAATRAPDSSLAYISSGGYDATEGLIPLTRMSSIDALRRVAYPNQTDPGSPDTALFHSSTTAARIRKAQEDRLKAQLAQQRLPRVKTAMSELTLARASDDVLKDLVLPADLVDLPGYQLSDLRDMMQQSQLAVAAFKAGLAVGVNLELGSFDTHANHDTIQVRQLAKLLRGIDYVVEQATAAGIYNQTMIMVGSDFGRGKGYNGVNPGDGKDHWPVSSAMFLSGDAAMIGGGRLIGGTDEVDQLPLPIDPDTLGTLELGDPGGVVITGAHLHLALRELAGVSEGAPAQKFKLPGEILPFFG